MWDFLKIYFKEIWLIVYHSPHIDIPIPKGVKIKLLGDSSIFTRTLQKLGNTKAEHVESSMGCTFSNEVLFQGKKNWKWYPFLEREAEVLKSWLSVLPPVAQNQWKGHLAWGSSDQPKCLFVYETRQLKQLSERE